MNHATSAVSAVSGASPSELDRLARRRAGAKMGRHGHGAAVWFAASGSGLRERIAASERRALGERDRA